MSKKLNMSVMTFMFSISLIFGNLINYNLNLVHNITFNNASNNFGVSDVWGYTDESGIEYAIVGYQYGTSIIDVSSSEGEFTEVANILGPSSGDYYFHRDYKTFGDYLYIVNEMYGGDVGMQVVDLSPLPQNPPIQLNTYNQISQSHNLWIDFSGFAYIEHQNGDNIHIADLSNPGEPIYGGSFNDLGQNCHDIFTRNGLGYISEGFSNRFAIYDISDITNISTPLGIIPCDGYAHNAWPNDSGTHLITTEETQNKTIKIWDISDMDNISLKGEYLGENGLAHNVHVKNDLVYISHYTTGIKIIDIFDVERPIEVAAYDTYPTNDDSGFYGCWGAYPFTTNNFIYASDMQFGLYILSFDEVRAGYVNGEIFFNQTIPLANAEIKSILNNKIYHTDENGYFDFGFPEGEQFFLINEQDTIQMNIIPHQETQYEFYLSEELIPGDLNQDEVIDVLDIIIVINFIMQISEPTISQEWIADINSDNSINIQDIILLIQIILNS